MNVVKYPIRDADIMLGSLDVLDFEELKARAIAAVPPLKHEISWQQHYRDLRTLRRILLIIDGDRRYPAAMRQFCHLKKRHAKSFLALFRACA